MTPSSEHDRAGVSPARPSLSPERGAQDLRRSINIPLLVASCAAVGEAPYNTNRGWSHVSAPSALWPLGLLVRRQRRCS